MSLSSRHGAGRAQAREPDPPQRWAADPAQVAAQGHRQSAANAAGPLFPVHSEGHSEVHTQGKDRSGHFPLFSPLFHRLGPPNLFTLGSIQCLENPRRHQGTGKFSNQINP